ncbi:hypothetical protein HCH_05465 [Hahella chejuensis KCTC 2396]|uniref:Uncharacterized protein n=1 Tax=Hahella chejuensis (strain KCTC 2396) TaxID=349521 RepID=Q2SB44_HAHCH|nr:hypothetical protein HCH_05465 [Hahella chejuensis KCTC 2396]
MLPSLTRRDSALNHDGCMLFASDGLLRLMMKNQREDRA